MRLHRFFTNEQIPEQGIFELADPGVVHQMKSVFRLRSGDEVILFNGDGTDCLCRIVDFHKNIVKFEVLRRESSRYMPNRPLWLCASVVKKDTFEWIAEKATELGVTDILPIIAERSEKKSLNIERLEKIVTEASEQSGRGTVPKLYDVVELYKAIDFLESEHSDLKILAFHTKSDIMPDVGLHPLSPTSVLIGPEGGWSEKEIALFKEKGIPVVCLGPQVLRAETAVVAILSKMVF
ncbi:MAG: 16S rRNA (uracil(1498)-N(3))-methyltransferase [Patescibacteria group bacterium]|nr:16S rRNA (uracil(1498)-N(3))-methyltransferase [Patescibacteria group bacterium]